MADAALQGAARGASWVKLTKNTVTFSPSEQIWCCFLRNYFYDTKLCRIEQFSDFLDSSSQIIFKLFTLTILACTLFLRPTHGYRPNRYNVVLQLAFRVITFAVNAVILRYTSSAMLGVVNVRLTLLYSTLLFVSREPVRKTCLSVQRGTNGVVWRRIANTSWLAAPIGCLLAAVLCWFHCPDL